MIKKKIVFILILLVPLTLIYSGIKNSRHNLSSGSGLGSIKASDSSMVCIFCHTSHLGNSFAPLWNRHGNNPVYNVYDSSTLHSIPGQPDGTSKLCLSCHDGTIALGKVRSRATEILMRGTVLGKIPAGRSTNLGTDLTDDHPVSFDASSAVGNSSEYQHPQAGDKVRYGKNGKLQCTSCHDPHNDIYKNFLVKENYNSSICKTCHKPTGYSGTATHDTSASTWNGTGQNPWSHTKFTSVTANSCQNCHISHNAIGKERLQTNLEEDICLICHNGNVGKNIRALVQRPNSHRVGIYSSTHDPTENIISTNKHVECVDCHNSHQTNGSSAIAPYVNGKLKGVSGMSITGSLIKYSQYEYEVCLKCHGQDKYSVNIKMNRQYDTLNIRTAINPANPSFHAMAATGKRSIVPSLRSGYTPSSRIYCSDCHNSNNSVNAGGSGPNGPHGSTYEYILERRYETSDYTNYSTGNYALCFKCHNQNILMSDPESGFKEHDKHVRGESTPCSACHDPHGSTGNIALINFDKNIVFPNSNGELKFELSPDRQKGYCYLNCHGEDHKPEDYNRNSSN